MDLNQLLQIKHTEQKAGTTEGMFSDVEKVDAWG